MNADDQTKSFDSAPGPSLTGHAYLLVIHGDTSFVYSLPRTGAVVVGRAPDTDLQIDAQSISRRHARFIVADDEASVTDMKSHNGTRVNGERIAGARTIVSGDIITIGEVVLVLRCDGCKEGRPILDLKQLRQRLSAEIERAHDYGRPLSVVALSLGDAVCDRAAVGTAAIDALRLMDVLGWVGASQLIVLLPELSGEAARSAAEKLLGALTDFVPGAKAGVVCYPTDGADVDALISVARAAMDIAKPGTISSAAETAIKHTLGNRTIVLADPAMIQLFNLTIRRVAAKNMAILILGENGTGKESVAAAIHEWSPRAPRPFISINCATLQDALAESELFGYEKGSHSEAKSSRFGLLETANGGTVFLDEVGDLPMSVQAKLLRALETKKIRRVGDVRERDIDIRIVAATNRDLEAACREGSFRRDLFFRLNGGTVSLPPLRHRPREIPILARMFLAEEREREGQPPADLSETALQAIASHPWPGNVRELKNAMAWAASMADTTVEVWDLPESVSGLPRTEPLALQNDKSAFVPLPEEVRQLEKTRIQQALDAAGSVQVQAARLISIPLRTFTYKMKQYGITSKSERGRT